MKSDEERLNFAIRFTEMEVEGLRRGDLLNLREDLAEFTGSEIKLDTLTPDSLKLIQQRAKQVLRQLVEFFHPKESPAEAKGIVKVASRVPGSWPEMIEGFFLDCSPPGNVRLRVKAALETSFIVSLASTLSKLDVSYLRECQLSSCSRLFFAEHGNQEFCTARCANRARIRRLRLTRREAATRGGWFHSAEEVKEALKRQEETKRRERAKRRGAGTPSLSDEPEKPKVRQRPVTSSPPDEPKKTGLRRRVVQQRPVTPGPPDKLRKTKDSGEQVTSKDRTDKE